MAGASIETTLELWASCRTGSTASAMPHAVQFNPASMRSHGVAWTIPCRATSQNPPDSLCGEFLIQALDGPICFPAYQPIAPLLYSWRNEHRIGSDEQGIGAMRAIMQGLTDAEFERLYGTGGQCLVAWVKARQDAGMPCPRCDNPKSYVYDRRVGCTRCDMRWSITSGTVMADTKLPLTSWVRAMHLMTSTKQCISAVELGRRLGVSYPTAWYLHKRLRHAMTEEADHCQLGAPAQSGWTPIVEADDVYLGGERNEGRGTAGNNRGIAAAPRAPH